MAPLLGVSGLLAAGVTSAQTTTPQIHWHVMGGYSAPVGTTADYLEGGYTIGGGFSVTPTAGSPLDFRFDFSYSEHNASNQLLNLGQQATGTEIDGGTAEFWSLNGNLVYHVPVAYGVRGYGIAGIGVYHSRVELSQFIDGGTYYCDPFSGFCDAGYGDALVASNEVTKFGWNAGLGIEFALPYGTSWFVEARYHRMNTSTPVEYVPIEVGYRF